MTIEEEPKPSRKERESARHRAEILIAAEQVFGESGFVSAKMEEIARRAEFAVGTLYKFFKSKEELYAALLYEKSQTMRKRLYAELERDAPAPEVIANLFRIRIGLLWEHHTFFRLFFHEIGSAICTPRAGFTAGIWEEYKVYLNAQEAVFQRGIEAGQFRGPEAAVLTTAFEGILRAYAMNMLRPDDRRREHREEEELLEIFMRGALAH